MNRVINNPYKKKTEEEKKNCLYRRATGKFETADELEAEVLRLKKENTSISQLEIAEICVTSKATIRNILDRTRDEKKSEKPIKEQELRDLLFCIWVPTDTSFLIDSEI